MFLNFLLMENLGAMTDSRYTGFREITDRDILELHCTHSIRFFGEKEKYQYFLVEGTSRMMKLSCMYG